MWERFGEDSGLWLYQHTHPGQLLAQLCDFPTRTASTMPGGLMDTVRSIPEILEAQKSTNWQVKAMLLTTDHSWGNHHGSHV